MTPLSPIVPPWAPPQARAGYVTTADTQLHYLTAGDAGSSAPPLVLMGGWPQSLHCWRHVFAPLAAHRQVWAIDPPGLGDSAKPAPAYDLASLARQVWQALDALELDRVDFVGFDVGMWIGYPLALQQPARVRRLALIDARIPGLVPWPPFNPKSALVSWHFAFNLLPELPELLIEGREREFLKWLFLSRTPTPGVFNDADFDEYARVYRGRASIGSAVGYYRALPESIEQVERWRSGPKLPMPVLAIAGAAGVGESMVEAVRLVADDTHGAVYEGCGHYVPEESPQQLLQDLLRFFA